MYPEVVQIGRIIWVWVAQLSFLYIADEALLHVNSLLYRSEQDTLYPHRISQ
jgi:hypothetical protein